MVGSTSNWESCGLEHIVGVHDLNIEGLRWAPQVRQQFRPEFINRIDEFIVFQALDKTQIMQIVRLQVRLLK